MALSQLARRFARDLRERAGRFARPARVHGRKLFTDDWSFKDVLLLLECLVFAALERLTARWRDETLWVFGARGGDGFVDNAKYLYLHVADERPDVRPVWISKNGAVVEELRANGYRAHYAYSPAGIATTLRAGVVVVTQGLGDVSIALSGGTTVVNLWHGIPLKRISFDAEFRGRSTLFRLAHRFLARRVDLLTLPGEGAIESFESGLQIDSERMETTGYPRTDALFERVQGSEVGLSEADLRIVERLAEEHTVLLYLPTYRSKGEEVVSDHFEFERLEAFLLDHDAHLFVKTHPFETLELEGAYDRVHELPAWTDAYPFLGLADVLLTDYSSVYFDFLVTDRPIVFYPFDLDRYRAERGFYFDYDAVTPGPKATDFEELLVALEGVLDRDDYAADRRELRERFVDQPTPGRSAAVYEAIVDRL